MLFLRRVRARRWSLLVAAVVAAAAALAVSYQVSFSASPLRERDRPYAVANLRVLIDSERDSAISDAAATPELLASRGGIYADLASSNEVVAEASSIAGVPDGAFAVIPVVAQSSSARSGLTAANATQAVPEGGAPSVAVSSTSVSPLLEFDGRSATERQAATYAAATATALSRLVERLGQRQDVRAADRIVLRRLGEPRTSIVANKRPMRDVVTLGLGVFAVLAALIIALDLLIVQARSETIKRSTPVRA